MTTDSNQTVLQENFYAQAACAHVVRCDCSASDLRKALLAAFILVKMAEKLFYVMNVYFHHNACDSKNHQLRITAFNHVVSLDQGFFDMHSTSEILGSMNVHSLNNLITWNIPYLCTLCVQLVMVAYFLASINLTLGMLSMVGMLIIKYGVLVPMEKLERTVHKVQRKLDTLNRQIVDEAFNMMSSVKMFSKEMHHIEEHEACQRRYMKNINSVVVLRCIREFAYGILKVCVFGGVLYAGLQGFSQCNLGPGDLTGFFLLLQKFQDLFGRIKCHYDILIREFPDIDRFLSLMKEESAIVSGTVRPQNIQGAIEFQDVRFEYPTRPGEEVLKGLILKIQPNKMTAVVGDSGAGKSTITKLIMRLYDPKAGSVLVDGYDLRTLDTKHLHEQIAIVSQNPELFNASLAENIEYGAANGAYSENKVKEAAALANCDFIDKFRAGLDTFAGARGAQLSGGQRQRIAIARAAIRDPRILILDEATSSLDAENEQLIQEALENIMEGRTTLVVAHRLSTIKNADEIICMKNGEVVERGTHTQLMQLGQVYYNLVSKQVIEEEWEKKKQEAVTRKDCDKQEAHKVEEDIHEAKAPEDLQPSGESEVSKMHIRIQELEKELAYLRAQKPWEKNGIQEMQADLLFPSPAKLVRAISLPLKGSFDPCQRTKFFN